MSTECLATRRKHLFKWTISPNQNFNHLKNLCLQGSVDISSYSALNIADQDKTNQQRCISLSLFSTTVVENGSFFSSWLGQKGLDSRFSEQPCWRSIIETAFLPNPVKLRTIRKINRELPSLEVCTIRSGKNWSFNLIGIWFHAYWTSSLDYIQSTSYNCTTSLSPNFSLQMTKRSHANCVRRQWEDGKFVQSATKHHGYRLSEHLRRQSWEYQG